MKSYLFVAKIKIQTALAYRFNVISTILIQCLIMYAMSCFWIAAYGGTETVSGVSQRDMITYTIISVVMGNLLTMGAQNRIAHLWRQRLRGSPSNPNWSIRSCSSAMCWPTPFSGG